MERISVCVPYWDRQSALDAMLANMKEMYAGVLDLEISLVDDGNPVPMKVNVGPDYPFQVIRSRLPTKTMPLNPCVPINRAVAQSTAEFIVLTNPEIVHVEDTLVQMRAMFDSITDYVTACCRDASGTMLAGPQVDYTKGGRLPVPAGSHFHFCAMFTRSHWSLAGGFDEDYRHGQGCDDNDWLWRVATKSHATFKSCPSTVLHYRSGVKWNLPFNGALFWKKWGDTIAKVQPESVRPVRR